MFHSGCATLQFVITDPFTSFLVGSLPQRQRPIPDKAGVSELDSQSLLLFSGWVEAIAECFADDHVSVMVERSIYQNICFIKEQPKEVETCGYTRTVQVNERRAYTSGAHGVTGVSPIFYSWLG